MADGGYSKPNLWLSDGWAIVAAEGWNAPGYWQLIDGAWFSMTLGGLRAVDPALAGLLSRQLLRSGCVCALGQQSFLHRAKKRSGKSRPRPALSKTPLARCGSGLAAPICLTRTTWPSRVRSASTTANSWSIRWCSRGFVAGDPGEGHSSGVCYRNFFNPRRAGNSAGCGCSYVRSLSLQMNPGQTALRVAPLAASDSFAADVISGLTKKPKRLPPEIFLRRRGFKALVRTHHPPAGILSDPQRT